MSRRKRKQIEERIAMIGKHLADAADYVEQNVNVEGSPYLHFSDWRGKSGHPLWMRNVMIPRSMMWREKLEKNLMKIDSKAKDKELTMRKRHGET